MQAKAPQAHVFARGGPHPYLPSIRKACSKHLTPPGTFPTAMLNRLDGDSNEPHLARKAASAILHPTIPLPLTKN